MGTAHFDIFSSVKTLLLASERAASHLLCLFVLVISFTGISTELTSQNDVSILSQCDLLEALFMSQFICCSDERRLPKLLTKLSVTNLYQESFLFENHVLIQK